MNQFVDALGKACPMPVIMAKKEIDAGNTSFVVAVDNQTAVENLKRLAESQGYQASVETKDGNFHVSFTGDGSAVAQADCRLGLLPQNPQALFTEITAEEELFDGLAGAKGSEKEKLERVNDMISLLRLEGERKLHPYDMSGGEQQRLALGKILLLEPQLLLLDEPTKGLDPFFKTILADILKKLQQQGVTICMVSHDIEFCAEYADTCAMFFDGGVVSQDAPRAFFGSNSFYTTASNRMSRHLFHGAITYRDVVDLCGRNLMPSN